MENKSEFKIKVGFYGQFANIFLPPHFIGRRFYIAHKRGEYLALFSDENGIRASKCGKYARIAPNIKHFDCGTYYKKPLQKYDAIYEDGVITVKNYKDDKDNLNFKEQIAPPVKIIKPRTQESSIELLKETIAKANNMGDDLGIVWEIDNNRIVGTLKL